ncbi:serine/threonine protein kinase [Laceyella putida]|uniref:non-specific serine/threonine protein kinase n=1 Tax=Laceyella putida TaxID=110101 RepID=A0ABW2RP01_9BACL
MSADFIKRINDATGMELNVVKNLPTRKGIALKVEENGTEMLLKAIELLTDDKTATPRTRSLQKEARILKEIHSLTGGLYVDSGKVDDHFWLLRKWLHGKTAFEYMSYARTMPCSLEHKRRFVEDLLQMLKKVMELYALGYLHGDLQPGHFIIDPEGRFHLIDLELAVKANDPDAAYRGALVHFVPPETASGMLVDDQHIPLDPVSEIYSFGAVAYLIYTGVVPVAYGETMEDTGYEFPFEEMLKAVAQGKVRSFAQAGAEPFPELEKILMKCLKKDRRQRYQTFEQLEECLVKLINELNRD